MRISDFGKDKMAAPMLWLVAWYVVLKTQFFVNGAKAS